jgi:putative ABC transporter, permease protein
MLITLLMPIVLLLLFGFAISMEVNDVRVVASADRHTDMTRELFRRFAENDYFTFEGTVTENHVEDYLRRGDADAAVIVRTESGRPSVQVIVDASNPTTGQAASAYVTGVVADAGGDMLLMRTLYNPEMKSSYNFVPGIMGMIFILICAIMTSVSIVREKESGTMDLLLVSPVRPHTIIFGKLVPYFGLSCIILLFMLTLAYTVLDLPFSSTVVGVAGISLLYIVLSLAIGLLVSTLVSSQLSALIVSTMGFMVPVLMLSGMLFPIDNMPKVLQWLSAVIPARWYIAAMRRLMIQQLGIGSVAMECGILASMTVALLALAITKFNSKK